MERGEGRVGGESGRVDDIGGFLKWALSGVVIAEGE